MVSYGPLAYGLLTGAITRETTFASEDWRSRPQDDGPFADVDGSLAVVERLRPVAERVGCTLAQLALAWNVHQPGVTAAIAGSRNEAHVRRTPAPATSSWTRDARRDRRDPRLARLARPTGASGSTCRRRRARPSRSPITRTGSSSIIRRSVCRNRRSTSTGVCATTDAVRALRRRGRRARRRSPPGRARRSSGRTASRGPTRSGRRTSPLPPAPPRRSRDPARSARRPSPRRAVGDASSRTGRTEGRRRAPRATSAPSRAESRAALARDGRTVSGVGTARIAGAYPSRVARAQASSGRRYCVWMDTRTRLEELLAQRILVLEGPKGTAIQALELSEEDFRGDLLKDHPRDIRGDNDLLGLTRPDIVESIHRDYLAAGAWILSTNTFNGSPVSQAEYGLEHLVYEMNRAAAETARPRSTEPTTGSSSAPSAPRTARSRSPRRSRIPRSGRSRSTSSRGVRGADPRPRRRRRGRPSDRDDLRHPEREGRDRGRAGRRARSAALALVHGRRPERPEPVGTDRRGVLALDRARRADDRRGQLLARRRADAPLPRGALAHRTHLHRLLPQRRPPERDGTARRGPGDHERLPRRVRARRPRQRPRGLLRDHPGHIRQIAEAIHDLPPRTVPSPTRPSRRSAASSPSSSAPTPGS